MEPLFEIIDGLQHIKIFADGKLEGTSGNAIIVNRLSLILHKIKAQHSLGPYKSVPISSLLGALHGDGS